MGVLVEGDGANVWLVLVQTREDCSLFAFMASKQDHRWHGGRW